MNLKIILDCFGGDNSPVEIIKGAAAALNERDDFKLVLAGKGEIINAELKKYKFDADRVEILEAPSVIAVDEPPAAAIKTKRDSSIVKSLLKLKEDNDAAAFVSAGSTGAVLAGAVIYIKRIAGINRPGLAPVLPTVKGGRVVLIDCGANPEAGADNLVQFASIGSIFASVSLGIKNPKIALLSNGTEENKGSALNKEAFPLLKEDAKINFIGNIEAREILSGEADVVVADGFSGNIALKASEGAALSLFDLIKDGIMNGGARAKLGYLLLKPVFKKVKKTMDYNESGGAVLLGLQKLVIKAHGSSKAKSIKAAIFQAADIAESGLLKSLGEGFSKE